MAALLDTDLLLLNVPTARADAPKGTYKIQVTKLSSHIIELIKDNGSGQPIVPGEPDPNATLFLQDLGDVDGTQDTNGDFISVEGAVLQANANGLYSPTTQSLHDIFVDEFTAAFGASVTYGLSDVESTNGAGIDLSNGANLTRYDDVFLLGAGTSFKPESFSSKVEDILNNLNIGHSDVEFIGDLGDVNVKNPGDAADTSPAASDGDILIFDGTTDNFELDNLDERVVGLINGGGIDIDGNGTIDVPITINPSSLPIADEVDPATATPEEITAARGIIAIDETDDNLVLTNGVLSTDITLPSTFDLKGTIEYKSDGATDPDPLADNQEGDLWVVIADTVNAPAVTDKTLYVDAATWTAANPEAGYTGVKVREGSIVVCVEPGDAATARFAVFGELDYSPIDYDLQTVLNEGATATSDDPGASWTAMELTKADIKLHTSGNFTTDAGNFATLEGDVTTGKGDIVIGTKGVTATPGGADYGDSILSVPNIDFDRFPTLS